MKKENAVPDWLTDKTFAIQYNPNCPGCYLIRLINPKVGYLDMKSYNGVGDDLSKDLLGFGKTLVEAAEEARKKLENFELGFTIDRVLNEITKVSNRAKEIQYDHPAMHAANRAWRELEKVRENLG